MSIYNQIIKNTIPKHIAIIMDGNGRWALEKGKNRFAGHVQGVKSVNRIVKEAIKLKIKYLTLFTFSKDNWARPNKEVTMLMDLFISTIKNNKRHFLKNEIKIQTIGNTEDLPKKCQNILKEIVENTKDNTGITLTLALSYSGRGEITHAINMIIQNQVKPKIITEELINNYLQTSKIPEPELLIRTSGEKRISNFLLWQIAYSELYFSEKKWPDFDAEELYMAIFEYQKRERRFGRTTEQIENEKF